MRIIKFLTLVLIAFVLIACSKPVPPEKSSYIGEWQSPSMVLLITQDGRVEYKRLEGGITKKIEAPLKKFIGDNFVVGVGPMSTLFVVTSIPHQVDGEWKMTVDGVELTKAEE